MAGNLVELFEIEGLNLEIREWFDLQSCLRLKMISKEKLSHWRSYEVRQVKVEGMKFLEQMKQKKSQYLRFSDFNEYASMLMVVYECETLLHILGIVFKGEIHN